MKSGRDHDDANDTEHDRRRLSSASWHQYPNLSFETVLDALDHWAEVRPDGLAFDMDGVVLTYHSLQERANNLAIRLGAHGVTPGMRCALLFTTEADAVCALFAAMRRRAIPVFLNPAIPAKTTLGRVHRVGAGLVIGADNLIADLRTAATASEKTVPPLLEMSKLESRSLVRDPQSLRPPRPEDTAYLQITSGTDGEPKAAAITHRNVSACTRAIADRIGIRDDDVCVSWVPLHHDLGLVRFLLYPTYAGIPVYMIPPSLANIERWLMLVSEVGGTLTGGPDFAYRVAARSVKPSEVDLSRLRNAVNGGEPVRSSTIEFFESRFQCPGVICPGYGLAEATLGVASVAPSEQRRVDGCGVVSSGRALEGIRIDILAEDGRECAPGETGHIVASGEQIFAGYVDDPVATEAVLRDGRLSTGDVGYLDEDGHLFVLGRMRAMVKRGGTMIIPREIEEAVDQVPGVRLSAAVGIPDPRGELTELLAVMAEVDESKFVTKESLKPLASLVWTRVKDAIGAVPDRLLLVKRRSIPRTANGKIQYGRLKEELQEESGELRSAVLFDSGPARSTTADPSLSAQLSPGSRN